MKQHLLVFIAGALLFGACKKSSSDSTSSTVSLSGSSTKFNYVYAKYDSANGARYVLAIAFLPSVSDLSKSITIGIFDPNPTTRTYHTYETKGVSFNYNEGSNRFIYNDRDSSSYLTVTSISNSSISGTFRAKVYPASSSDTTAKILSGSFTSPIK